MEDENGKTENWRDTYRGVDLKKMRFVPGAFSRTNSPTSCTWRKVVDGYKRNIVGWPKHHIRISRGLATLMWPIVRNTECDPLVFTTPIGATHGFLQHLQFYQTPADSMEARAGNSILDFETLFADFQELLNGSGLIVAHPHAQGWLAHSKGVSSKSQILKKRSIAMCEYLGKTGVTADRDKIELRLFNSRSAMTSVFPYLLTCVTISGEGKMESRPTVTRLCLGCLILVRSLI